MRHGCKRGTFADDCLLALFTLTLTGISVACFGGMFPWQATFAVLMAPTVLLCGHLRYRAAAIAAAIALVTGAWIIVPPRWSLRIDSDALPAVVLFAGAAVLAIMLAARNAAQSSMVRARVATRVPGLRRA